MSKGPGISALFQRTLRRVQGWGRANRGTVTIEFALIAPVLLLLLLHVVDFGLAFNQRMKLESAARAGLQYAMFDKDNTVGIQAAVTGATDLDADDMTVTVTEFCECNGVTATCGVSCDDGAWPGTYVQISATSQFNAIFSVYGLQDVFNLEGSAIGRVQ